MAIEDYSTYTETDPDSNLTVTSSKITCEDLQRDTDTWVYKDAGVDHFSGDFEHDFDAKFGTTGETQSLLVIWCLANAIDDLNGLRTNSNDELDAVILKSAPTSYQIYNGEDTPSGTYFDVTVNSSHDDKYWCTAIRDESIGTYGTYYLYIYFTSFRTTLYDTLILTLHDSKKDFRYIYAANNHNDGVTANFDGFVQDLDLHETASVPVFYHQRQVQGMAS